MLIKIRVLIFVLLSLLKAFARTEMKRVVGDNTTLPCYHNLWQANTATIDIEWLLVRPSSKQTVVITYFAGQVFDPNENEVSRASFMADYLRGDASLLISDLSLSDTGEYTCKVKNGGRYHWSTVNLLVLMKPSKPQCRMEGQILEGKDVTMSCKSTEGSDPIHYNWERVADKEKYVGKLPSMAKIDLKNPEIMMLRNLTKDSAGLYRCTASNDAGEESCIVEVKLHYGQGMGVVAGAVVGVTFGVLLIFFLIWIILCTKGKKYEEEETPNEIREDVEAPKSKLVKPNSISSHSGSTHSETSTQSAVHRRGLVPPHPVVAAFQGHQQTAIFPLHPPGYDQMALGIPESGSPKPNSPKMCSATLVRMGGKPVMIPAQTKAFQMV